MNKRHLLDNPRFIKLLVWLTCITGAGLFAFDFFFHRHVTHPFEHLYGFYAIYGFSAYCLLVVIAKGLRKLVKRREDYYGDD